MPRPVNVYNWQWKLKVCERQEINLNSNLFLDTFIFRQKKYMAERGKESGNDWQVSR